MYRITHFGATNFMSFRDVSITPERKCYVIRANNLDNDGQQSNGGGKTSLVDIIPVTILGQSLTGRNLKDCVNWNTKDNFFTTQVILENLSHKLSVLIKRTVYNNSKSSELIILVNGEVPKTLPTKAGVENGVDVKAGNEYILNEILGISKEDLLNYYFISANHYTPFLRANVDKKTEIISRFSNASVIDQITNSLALELKEGEKSERSFNEKISSLKGYIEALEDGLNDDAKKQFEDKKESDIKKNQDKIDALVSKITDNEYEILELQKKIESFNLLPVDKEAIDELMAIKNDLLVELKNSKRLIVRIENHLAGLIKCPKCEHEFSLSSDEFCKEDLTKTRNSLNTLNVKVEECSNDISLVEEEMSILSQNELENNRINSEIKNIKSTIASISNQQKRIGDEIETLEFDLEQISAVTFDDKSAYVKEQIKEKKKELAKVAKDITFLVDDLAQKSTWIDRFGEFKFHLANRPIEQIAALINDNLKAIGSDLNIAIEGFKRLKSGELRPDLNGIIYRNWTNPQPYLQFSEGEKTRLNLAFDLALQHLINLNSKFGGLDWVQNDELLNPLDSMGVKKIAESFNLLGKTIMLVSHSGSDMTYDNIIEVEKKDGISRIC